MANKDEIDVLRPELASSNVIVQYIDPALALPGHLQTASYEEDLWRRMSDSPLRPPQLSTKLLRDNADARDLLRAAISAASEREKEVLLHNQARVFGVFLLNMGKNIGKFLNTPPTPESWYKRKVSKKRAFINLDADVDQDAVAGDEKNPDVDKDEDQPDAVKEWVSFLLTPKTILLLIVLMFGIIAGYSQIQIRNLTDTITTFERNKQAMQDQADVLQKRIADFDTLKKEQDDKYKKTADLLTASENRAASLEKDVSEVRSSLNSTKDDNEKLKASLDATRAGSGDTQKQLQDKIDLLTTDNSNLKAQVAALTTENDLTKKAEKRAQDSFQESNRIASTAQGTVTDLQRELGNKELLITQLRQTEALYHFADECISDIHQLRNRYNNIKASDLDYYFGIYDDRKRRRSQ